MVEGASPPIPLVSAVPEAGSDVALVGLQQSFDEAAEAAGGAIEHRLTIVEGTVNLRFAGRAVADLLMPAFAHLRSSDDEPTLTLHAWDAATTSSGRPAFAPPQIVDGNGIPPDATGPGRLTVPHLGLRTCKCRR